MLHRAVLGLLQRLRFLSRIKDGCNSKERDGMEDLCRHHLVMQAGWNVFPCLYSA